MTVTLSIRLLTGRFHGTPWNHQVNEGVVECPPSPWRILRALVSAYYHLAERPPRQQMCQLMTLLAETLPAYQVPPYTTAHTRHYMPLRKEGKETTTKVLDTFLVFGRATTISTDAPEIQVVWQKVDLNPEQSQLLERLCENLSYLGRAESWCEISLVPQPPLDCNVTPLANDEVTAADTTLSLVPLSSQELEVFQTTLSQVPKPKRAKWQIPQDILQVLELDIGDLHRQGWHGVPGARWATYKMGHIPVQTASFAHSRTRPTVARFDLAAKVLPPLTEVLRVGECFRKAFMSQSDELLSYIPPVFSGRNQQEEKQSEQRHAWYFPEDSDGDGRIDRVWVIAADGFAEEDVRVLRSLTFVWSGKAFQLQTFLTGLVTLEEYGCEPRGPGQPPSLLGRSRVWRSRTPFILPRHPKRKVDPVRGWQVDGVESQALRLLSQLPEEWSIDEPLDIRVLSNAEMGGRYPWFRFRRRRLSGEGHKSSDRGYWVELEFEQPQTGPMAIGYGAHFGLGLLGPYFCARG